MTALELGTLQSEKSITSQWHSGQPESISKIQFNF